MKHFIKMLFLFLVTGFLGLAFFLEFQKVPSIYFYSVDKHGHRHNRGVDGIYAFSPLARVKSQHLVFNSEGLLARREYNHNRSSKSLRILWLGGSIAWGWPFQYDFERRFKDLLKTENIELISCTVPVASLGFLNSFARKNCSQFQDIDYVFVQATFSGLVMPYGMFYGDQLISNWYNHLNLTLARGDSGASLADMVSGSEKSLSRNEIQLLRSFYSPRAFFYDTFAIIRYVENRLLLKQLGGRKAKLTSLIASRLWKSKISSEPVLKNMQSIQEIWPEADTVFYIAPTRTALDIYSQVDSGKTLGYSQGELQQINRYRDELTHLKEKMLDQGLGFVDLYDYFSSQKNYQDYFLQDDWHPNEKGYDVLVSRLWKHVGKKRWR